MFLPHLLLVRAAFAELPASAGRSGERRLFLRTPAGTRGTDLPSTGPGACISLTSAGQKKLRVRLQGSALERVPLVPFRLSTVPCSDAPPLQPAL